MKKFDIEDYKLEIIVLQQKDTQMAKENGFMTKKAWFEYLRTQKDDEIAQAVIEVAQRYDLPLERVAYDFDTTMIMRVGRILSAEKIIDISSSINQSKAA